MITIRASRGKVRGRSGYHESIQGEGKGQTPLKTLALFLDTGTHPLQLGASNATGSLIAQQHQQAHH